MNTLKRKAGAAPQISVTSFPPGETVVEVPLYPPFVDGADVVVLATPQGAFGVHVSDVSESGFKLHLAEPQTEAVRVAWQVAVAKPQLQPRTDDGIPVRTKPSKPHPKPNQMVNAADVARKMADAQKAAQSVHAIAGFRGA